MLADRQDGLCPRASRGSRGGQRQFHRCSFVKPAERPASLMGELRSRDASSLTQDLAFWDPTGQGWEPQKLAGRSGLRFSKKKNKTTSSGTAPSA